MCAGHALRGSSEPQGRRWGDLTVVGRTHLAMGPVGVAAQRIYRSAPSGWRSRLREL